MNTKTIRELCDSLDKAEKALADAIAFRRALDCNGHQETISVSVGNRRIELSTLGRETGYASKLIRGREMIHLGAIKIANVNIDACRRAVAIASQALNAEAAGKETQG